MAITILFGVLVVIGVCLVAVTGLELVQRLVPAEKRQEHNDVAGFLYAVVGVVYAVLLALLVIAVWEQYQRALETVEGEADSVADIAWLAHRLPEAERYQLQEHARSYAQEVVDEEWPLMEKGIEGQRGTPEAWNLIDDMRATLQDFEPSTAAEQNVHAEGLDQIDRLGDDRRIRFVAAEEGIPGILWAVLVFGAVVVVGFTYLFGMRNSWAHRLMVLSLTAVIELILERFETSKLSDL